MRGEPCTPSAPCSWCVGHAESLANPWQSTRPATPTRTALDGFASWGEQAAAIRETQRRDGTALMCGRPTCCVCNPALIVVHTSGGGW